MQKYDQMTLGEMKQTFFDRDDITEVLFDNEPCLKEYLYRLTEYFTRVGVKDTDLIGTTYDEYGHTCLGVVK